MVALKQLLIDILKGVGLLVALWIIDTFIAFVPFSRASNTEYIITTWLVVDILLVMILNKEFKFFNKVVWFAFIAAIGLLTISYFLPLNSNIPAEALELNSNLNQQYENKYDYAKALFFALEVKYSAPIRQYLLEPWKVFFIKDFAYFWNLPEGSYADSSTQGRMYQIMLLESGRFDSSEVILHQGFCSNSPHLLVDIHHPEKGDIWADFWAVDNFPGVESNKTYEFGMRAIRPCNDLIGTGY